MTQDWLAWHEGYGSPDSGLGERLDTVRTCVAAVLRSLGSPTRVLSLCAGDGRDLIPVMAGLGTTVDLSGTLIEISPELARRATAAATAAGVHIDAVVADAGDPQVLAARSAVDLLLLCGIFGNVPDDDVRRTVAHAGRLVHRGGHVIWTRHRRAPDLTPAIRTWFADEGFDEVGFHSPGPGAWSVGVHRNASAAARPIRDRLFTFTR